MSTRAIVGTIETDAAGNQVLTSTYNHYDGYPESLGVALNNHYNSNEDAVRISNQGYISFLDPETGEVDAKNKKPAGLDKLPDNFEEAMYVIHDIADSMGADYVYIYDFDAAKWLNSRNIAKSMINKFKESGIDYQFDTYEDDDLGIPGDNAAGLEEIAGGDDKLKGLEKEFDFHTQIGNEGRAYIIKDKIEKLKKDMMEEGYEVKWQKFLNEAKINVVAMASDALKDEPNLQVYLDSLENDIRLNGSEDYETYTTGDWEEDFENYMADKMDY